MKQPKGFKDPEKPHHVYRLRKALYGLKRAPQAWYYTLAKYLLTQGYVHENANKTLFIKKDKGDIILVQVYVDDLIFGSLSKALVDEFVSIMTKRFDMSMFGDLRFFLGLQVTQFDDGIFVTQCKYAEDLVRKFSLTGAKSRRTPMSTTCKLTAEGEGQLVDQSLYRSMIGSLLYLTASRPDITYSVGVYSRFQSNPEESHLSAVKNIVKYVKGTSKLGLWFANGSSMELVGYSDADWDGNLNDRRSTTGGCFYLGENLISWHTKK